MKWKRENVNQWAKSALYNIETLQKAQNSVIKLFDDYSRIVSEVKHKPFHGKRENINS